MGATTTGGPAGDSGEGTEQARRELGQDLHATLGARRELGDNYDKILADSFVERLDQMVARRVAEETQRQGHDANRPWTHEGPPLPAVRRGASYPTSVAYASLALGIPISGAAGGTGGVGGLAVAWLGIAVVNVATALGHRRVQPPEHP